MKNNQKSKHLRNKILFTTFQYICLFLPYIIIMICKHDVYFTKQNTISMSIGCIMCIVVAAIIMAKKIKLLKGIGGFVVAFTLSILMDSVLQDLTLITGWGMAGCLVSMIFEHFANKETKYLDAYIGKEVFTERE